MALTPMSPPPTPGEGATEAPSAPRRSLWLRTLIWALLLMASIAAVVLAGLFVLPHAADVQRLPNQLHWLKPVCVVLYAVAFLLVWTRGVEFLDWLAARRGANPLPAQVSRAARNCLAALFALMELTVLLHWLSEGAR